MSVEISSSTRPPVSDTSSVEYQPEQQMALANKEAASVKATKADDAAIPFHLWDSQILKCCTTDVDEQRTLEAINLLWKWLHKVWVQKTARDFWSWWLNHTCLTPGPEKMLVHSESFHAGMSARRHAVLSTWWDWDGGSSHFFWRFPPDWMRDMRNGLPLMWISLPLSYTKRQPTPSDPSVRHREWGKLDKVRKCGYIAPLENIRSLTSFFSDPKGETNVRMVYDGTKSGLTASLFAPWFSLATVDTMLKSVGRNMWAADNNFGEMFLNFWNRLDFFVPRGTRQRIQAAISGWQRKVLLWEAWTRCAMGLTTSLFQATQSAQRMKRLALGNRLDETNVFRWKTIHLNLPGDKSYMLLEPWVSKRRADGTVAADVHVNVDDLQETAPTSEEAWLAASPMAKTAAFGGLQDTAQKCRPPGQTPGVWVGGLVQTTGERVYKLVSNERWEKVKGHIATLKGWSSKGMIDRKALEQIQGFLV